MSTFFQWFLTAHLAIILIAPSVAADSNPSRKLTESEAQEVARLALAPNSRALPNLRFDSYGGYPGRPGFYWFEITGSVPRNTSPVLGHYAVNQATGDVWEPVQCKRVGSPELRGLQRRIRKRIGLSNHDLRELSKMAPCEP